MCVRVGIPLPMCLRMCLCMCVCVCVETQTSWSKVLTGPSVWIVSCLLLQILAGNESQY